MSTNKISPKTILSSQSRYTESVFNKNSFSDKTGLAGFIKDLMNEKGLKAPEIYNRVNITKQTWSHIYSAQNCPTSENARLLLIGLKCSLPEAEKLLKFCGMCFIPGNIIDDAIKTCLKNKVYELDKIEEHIKYAS